MKFYIISATLLFFILPSHATVTDRITYNLSFPTNTLQIETAKEGEAEYCDIKMTGLDNDGEIGAPLFPRQTLTFSIPFFASNLKIETKVSGEKTIILNHPPLLVHDPELSSLAENKKREESINEYALHKTRVSLGNISSIGGINKIVSVVAYPVIWDEVGNSLSLCDEIEIVITWDIDTTHTLTSPIPSHEQSIRNAITLTKGLVVNPEDVEGNSYWNNIPNSQPKANTASIEEYIPYVIITTRELAKSMERLAAFRRLRGFNTRIYCIEDILTDSRYSIGDFISNINDEAGKLRAFLFYERRDHGTEYVLLAGPYPQIPARWMTRYKLSEGNREDFITDQYYRDLSYGFPKINEVDFGNFDNLRYTSYDMNVGRLNCSTTQEINNYIDKLLQYEFNIAEVDQSYHNNAYVMIGSDEKNSMVNVYNTYIDHIYRSNFEQLIVDAIATSESYSGNEAIQNMNMYRSGFVDWRGHGADRCIVLCNTNLGYYGITAIDGVSDTLIKESDNGLNSLNNAKYPSWTLSMSCSLTLPITKTKSYSIAESYLLGKDYGGVVFIGNSGSGLTYYSSFLCKAIFNSAVELHKSGSNIPFASVILNKGCVKYSSSSSTPLYENTVIGVHGDPLVPLWLKKPLPSQSGTGFSSESLAATEKVNIGIQSFDNNKNEILSGIISEQPNEEITINYTKLLSRSDMNPYIYPINFSGMEIREDKYIFLGDLKMNNKNTSSLSVSENANLIIETIGNGEVSGKVEVDNGSSFNLKSHKSIELKDSKIIPNGKTVLESPKSITIGKNTIIEKGSSISFTISND